MFKETQKGEFTEGLRKAHWEHVCTSCHLEGSTVFEHNGDQKKMDVYGCSDHTQPGIYGMKGTKFEGDRMVVRYGQATNDTIGEISYNKDTLDLQKLRLGAKNGAERKKLTVAEIALGKVL